MKTFLVCYFIVLWLSITGLFADKTKEESINDGQEIYQDFCVQCHLANGTGVSGVFPPLKASDYLFENIEKSIAGVKYGLRGEIVVNDETYDGVMTAQGLDNEEIADVMNYILNNWGNRYENQITPMQVNEIPKSVLE
ncbi:c-type cytochrome [Flavobacteriaceae bacterium]|jgi:mono/diheme cytochrome c family protein|nr:c-type cytochrome [Flavobacteriaceae bacterium]MDB2327488.1 c-type cytochrome [Flavobacteriaceae bacterium]